MEIKQPSGNRLRSPPNPRKKKIVNLEPGRIPVRNPDPSMEDIKLRCWKIALTVETDKRKINEAFNRLISMPPTEQTMQVLETAALRAATMDELFARKDQILASLSAETNQTDAE